ncbi:class C beta-lactamase [Pseudomonas sp. NA-150]|uniref:class C beta-lactamase n=1 Tax=Pseudomonas sp. NA-150 TaxID=3367525 RepID=UPI0037CB82D1
MRSIGKHCATLLLIAGTASFGELALAVSIPPTFDTLVNEAVAAVMKDNKIPGVAVAITVDGKLRYYNFGVASRDTQLTITRDTLFEIGSVSKTFTATLASYAQANNQLSLGDSPGKYLPELKGSPLDNVMLINLATHTAGGFPLQLPDSIQDTAQLMDYFKSWQPKYPTGTERSYANPSVALLGMATAKSLGMSYEAAMEQQLFPALGLPNTWLDVPQKKIGLYAQGYAKDDAPVRVGPGVIAAEAYGVKTSAKDLIHFVEANMGMVKLEPSLKSALLDTHTGYFTVGPMTQDLIWEQYPHPVELDTLVAGNASKMTFDSNPVTALNPPLAPQKKVWINKTGSTNGFGAYVAFVPTEKIGIVVLANKNYPNEARVRLAYRILTALEGK